MIMTSVKTTISMLQPFLQKQLRRSLSLLTNYKAPRVDGDALRAVIGFIYSDKPVSQLKHVITQAACGKEDYLCRKNGEMKSGIEDHLMIMNCASFVRSFT